MYAIGHFALGYLTGKSAAIGAKVKVNMPLLLVASVIPDIDLVLRIFLPNLIMHRVQTHSIITFTLAMIPFFIIYRKKALPYYFALLSHALIGDFFTGGVGLFWPLSNSIYGIRTIEVTSPISLTAEISLFAISLPIMVYTKDLQSLLKPNKYNFTLVIPFFAVLVPTLLAGREMSDEGSLPLLLIIPSLFWLITFAYSGLITLRAKLAFESSQHYEIDHQKENSKTVLNCTVLPSLPPKKG